MSIFKTSREMYTVIKKCQNVMATWRVPGSTMTDYDCLNELFQLLNKGDLVTTMRQVERYPFNSQDKENIEDESRTK
jgi:hypothetical protein